MKWIREILPRGKEAAFASGLLLLYAMELFLSPDPAWTMWAAQMAIGVLYVPEAPTLQGIAPGESLRVMSAAGAFRTIRAGGLPGAVVIVKGRTEPFIAWKYREGRWKERRWPP